MTDGRTRSTNEVLESIDDIPSNTSDNATMGEIIAARYSRREVMRGALAAAAISATVAPMALDAARGAAAAAEGEAATSSFGFREIKAGVDETHHVARGYEADVLIRWGDPVVGGAPAFDPLAQTAAKQEMQFGYNNDFVGFVPLEGAADHGLLVVNHEYTNPEVMFPGFESVEKLSKTEIDVTIAAHGGSVVEIRRDAKGRWQVVADSRYNRRITAETPMQITGPAAGSDRLKTSQDQTGAAVRGMINNCAGGVTPWGTWLTCEENFNNYFGGELPAGDRNAESYERYGITGSSYNGWERFYRRFDLSREPNEANRFGWVVEIDPMNPNSKPKKRTAMGRFKHEGAGNIINKDGRFVVYQGDDQRFDYVYRFVTAGKVDLDNRENNRDLLDEGTLYVARFKEDGTGRWMPLVYGEGPLTAENGFRSQADVVIDARLAADLLGATKMDRPEDVEANASTNKVYVMLTNNTDRKPNQVNAANPRPDNAFGHIVEITPKDDDHTANNFTWDILLKCGDPSIAKVGATFSAATTENGWFGMPDNCAVDNQGRLWVSTDGNNLEDTGRADGLWAIETEGALRGTSKHFFRVPLGAEMCGPYFTPDDETLFLAVQHPGTEGDSTFEKPSTRWPDFKKGMPPRPSVLAVTKNGGGKIAGTRA